MNGYERILHAIDGKPVDRPPVWPFVMTFAARYASVPYGRFASDHREMLKALIKTAEDFSFDAITVDSDAYREASACGAILEFPEDDLPVIKRYAITNRSEFSFKQPRIEDSQRLMDKIEGVRKAKEYFRGEKAVAGWIEAPLQSAGTLYSLNDYLSDLFDEPEFIKELVGYTTELGIRFAGEQIKAGADIIGIGDAMASLVSPAQYEEFFLPYTKQLVHELKRKYDAKLKYHICGNAVHLLRYVEEMGFDIVNIDYPVDMKTAIEMTHGNVCIKGNVSPMLIQNGPINQIEEAVKALLDLDNPRFILSPGCEVVRDTPTENLLAFARSAEN